MIEKILKIPDYTDMTVLKANSHNLKIYLVDDLITKLREVYQCDKELFNILLEELMFRGIEFNEEYQNNYFRKLPYKPNTIIEIENDEMRFKKIDFSSIGIGDFINRYNVKSDYFFKDVPIEGLMAISSNPLKRDLIYNSFLQVGFKLSPINIEKKLTEIRKDLINDNFNDKQYNHFNKFCALNGINYCTQINNEVLQSYSESKGVRQKTIKKVIKRCEELNIILSKKENQIFSITDNPLSSFLSKHNFNYSEFLDNVFSEENLIKEETYEYGVTFTNKIIEQDENIDKSLLNENYELMLSALISHSMYDSISKLTLNEFFEIFDEVYIFPRETIIADINLENPYIYIVKKIMKKLEGVLTFQETIKLINKTIPVKNKEIFVKRNNGNTLESISKDYNVTRERIRQINLKTEKIIKENIPLIHLRIYLKNHFKKNKILDINSFASSFSETIYDTYLFNFWLINCNDLIQVSKSMFVEKEYYNKIEEKLLKTDYSSSVIEIENLRIESAEERKIVEIFLLKNNYKYFNGRFIKNKMSIIDKIEYIMTNLIDSPIKCNEENYIYFQKKFHEIFDTELNSGERAFFSRLASTPNVILVDSGTFAYEDFSETHYSFIKWLESEINIDLELYQHSDPRRIFDNNKSLMLENKITTHFHLYSYIKKYFKDDYIIGKGNTLYIYNSKKNKLSNEDILLDYAGDNKTFSYDKVIEDLKWEPFKLDQLLFKVPYLLIDEKKDIHNIKGIEDEEYYEALITKITDYFSKGYVITLDMFTAIFFDEKFSSLLQKYRIIDLQIFSNFLKSRLNNVRGYKQFLYLSDSKIKKIEDIIPMEMNDFVSKKDIINFIIDKAFSEQKIYKTIEILISSDKLVPYTPEVFINTMKIEFDQNIITEVDEILKNDLNKQVFLSYTELQLLNKYSRFNSSIKLTPTLIAFFAEELGYILLEAYAGSKYELPIILNKSSHIKSYDELIFYYFKEFYEGVNEEKLFLDFLKENNLVNKSTDTIYESIKRSEYFIFDGLGYFEARVDA